jgi:hypothetical protein
MYFESYLKQSKLKMCACVKASNVPSDIYMYQYSNTASPLQMFFFHVRVKLMIQYVLSQPADLIIHKYVLHQISKFKHII